MFTREDAYNIANAENLDESAKLEALFQGVISNYEATSKVAIIKNKTYSGDPQTGSITAKRFANAKSQEYGTARSAQAGNKATVKEETIAIDTKREIIEEFHKSDIDRFGIPNLIAKRWDNFVKSMRRELDRAFYSNGVHAGNKLNLLADADPFEILAQIITLIETIENDYVDGIERDLIHILLKPSIYNKVKAKLDVIYNANTNVAIPEVGKYHGVMIHSEHYLPQGIEWYATVEEATAQPVAIDGFSTPEKIQFSKDYALSLFYDYGVQTLADDLVFYGTWPNAVSLLQMLGFKTRGGSASGTTMIEAILPELTAGNKYRYELVADLASLALPKHGDDWSGAGYTDYTIGDDIAVTAEQYIVISEVTSGNLVVKTGYAKIVKKA